MAEENNTEKKGRGGARVGAGRKVGYESELTKEKRREKQLYVDRINKNAQKLFDAQYAVALGVTLLFRVRKDSKGRDLPAEQVTDPTEVQTYIDGELQDGNTYYFIATQKPNSKAIDSMLDRAWGKARQDIDIKSGGQSLAPAQVIPLGGVGVQDKPEAE